MSKPVTRYLSYYDGRQLLGFIEITPRPKRAPKVKAKDATGKNIGSFRSLKAVLFAIDAAAAAALQPDRQHRC